MPSHSPIDGAARRLDNLRAGLLRWTLSADVLRRIFVNRAHRNFALFLVFILLAWLVSCLVPLWQLLLGPMFYGYMHLFTSVRYFHYAAANDAQLYDRRIRRVSFALLIGLAATYIVYRVMLRYGADAQVSEWQGAAVGEGVFVVLVFIAGAAVYRKSVQRVVYGVALLGPFVYLLLVDPDVTIGALVLGHNVVAFVYWLLACRSRQDRTFAALALLAFLLVNVGIFAGAFDTLYAVTARTESLEFAGLTYDDLGGLIFPWTDDPDLRFHAVAALAFGQSTHYFVWLKAIPDQYHHHRIPTTFRQSARLMRRDFGRHAAHVIIYAVVATALLWIFLAVRQARVVYFLIAGFHGYLEIAGLGLIGVRRGAVPRPLSPESTSALAPSPRAG